MNYERFQGQTSSSYVKVKRAVDVVLSAFLLSLSVPFFLVIAVAVKLESKGEVFFVQDGLGLHKRPFKFLKFRTMIDGAESEAGPIWANENDTRITTVGRLLRRNRMDELPQLLNIFKGNMSFVGPRPIREQFANQLTEQIPFCGLRFSVKPGLSGWAQVNHDYAGSREGQMEKFQYELFYIQNMSLTLDLLTVVKTLTKVFQREGT